MPYLPNLTEGNQTRAVIETFGGYNHNLRIGEGEWYDEKNLTSEHFPMFSQRRKRGVYHAALDSFHGIIAKDALAWVDDGKLFYNGEHISGIMLSEGDKQLVSMGAYLCIFPDNVYFNTVDRSYGNMWAREQSALEDANGNQTPRNVTFTPCRQNGDEYDADQIFASPTEPAEPDNGEYWMDTGADIHILKQYSSTSGMWVQIPTVYTKIGYPGVGKSFKQYDGVHISGIEYTGENTTLGQQLAAMNSNAVIQNLSDDYIIVVGLLDQQYVQTTGNVVIERKVPQMDFVCEANNRLWGCKYGMVGGQTVNEIYACKQGDFKNWNCFMGLSTDSYTASVGSDGKFTGCIAYLGNPLFFKENCIHRMSGMMPANYQLTTTTCRGVQDGSHRSLAIVNEILYYKSRSDICAYDGSLPVGVSSQFGTDLYSEACAGAHGGKYYVSMKGSNGQWNLFVYDTQRGVWHREDNTHATGFASWSDELYFIDADRDNIIAENGTEGVPEEVVAWEATSGLIGYELIDHKYISRFNFRMKLAKGAKIALAIEYDSDGVWIDQGVIYGHGTDSFVIPVIPQRCDHFRIRLSGAGDIKIYSITKMIEQGSDA